MRETKFIEQNKGKWEEYERMLMNENVDPEKLNELYINVTDDLSFSRTYYPNRTVRAYLNGLASKIFQNLYTREKFPWSEIKRFWTTSLPQIVWDSRKALLVSLALFVTAFTIGVLSCMIDPEFPRVILGDDYVNMTIENIKKGDPMAVYKDREMFGMSGTIAINNLWVAFLTMILGMIASIGTIFIMLYNGVMIGAFQYMFVQQQVFWESFLTIWIHGTLEVSAIIIAGGAGLVAGSGWIFPGTYTRAESFRLSMVRGFKIFLGIIPIIILAAIFEGYLTRATDTPDVIRAAFIVVSLSFVLWYFVWYPWYKARKTPDVQDIKDELPPSKALGIQLNEIKSSGQVFNESMGIFMKGFSRIGGLAFVLSLIFSGLMAYFVFQADQNIVLFTYDFPGVLEGTKKLLHIAALHPVQWLHIGFMAMMGIMAFRTVQTCLPDTSGRGANPVAEIITFLVLASGSFIVCQAMQYENYLITLITMTVIAPVTGFLGYIAYSGNYHPVRLFQHFFSLFSFKMVFAVSAFIALFSGLIYIFMESQVFDFLMELISANTMNSKKNSGVLYLTVQTFAAIWTFYTTFAVLLIGMTLIYYSSVEQSYAKSIFDRIKDVGAQKRIRGLPKE